MIVLSHPTGNANVRAVLQALNSHKMLSVFYTTLAVKENDWVLHLLPPGLRRQAMRRGYEIATDKIARFPQRELLRHLASKLRVSSLTQHETGWASVDAVYRDLDFRVANILKRRSLSSEVRGVYCYEDGALQTFQATTELGLKCLYEIPIAYWQTSARLLAEEAERWPQWEPTLGGTRDSDAKRERKTQELELANLVITPSRFVYDSLPATIRAQKPCHVVEFGSPSVLPSFLPETEKRSPKLRVLFVGSMTQRKGLADLFAAIKSLDRRDVELVVMGSPMVPLSFYRQQYADFLYEPPRPHAEVLRLMQSCDVLALPSLVEGRALVQQEAMACGLPLIVTVNAGGDDLIEEGKTGFIVPIRSPEAIAEKIDWLADHPLELAAMKKEAKRKAAEYTWQRYGETVATRVAEALDWQH